MMIAQMLALELNALGNPIFRCPVLATHRKKSKRLKNAIRRSSAMEERDNARTRWMETGDEWETKRKQIPLCWRLGLKLRSKYGSRAVAMVSHQWWAVAPNCCSQQTRSSDSLNAELEQKITRKRRIMLILKQNNECLVIATNR